MADVQFLFLGGFAEGAAEGLVKEEWIVAEDSRPSRGPQNPAYDRAAPRADHAVTVCQGDRAYESRATVFHVPQILQQEAVVGSVGGALPGVARRKHARPSTERVYFQPGIVGEEKPGHMARIM